MRKYALLMAFAMGISVLATGCKASKQEITESSYYQELQDKNDKLEQQLKDSQNDVKELNSKIKSIHEYTGDQKLASYKRKVKKADISKVDMMRIGNDKKYQGFAVTNKPVCDYVKKMVADSYRIIGLTVSDVEKKYKNNAYSYALIDEDNTTYDIKVYGNSYIVFDKIPENVYCFNDANILGDALIDATVQKNYSSWVDKIEDASLVVTDTKLKFSDDIVKAGKYFNKIKNSEIKNTTFQTSKWNEYRFYTGGSITTVYLGDSGVVAVKDAKNKVSYYSISTSNMKKLKKTLS
ncbi:MAG: hypothetical protein ACOX1S_02980 [Anaerostipes sp.]|jgi:hypothetical protein